MSISQKRVLLVERVPVFACSSAVRPVTTFLCGVSAIVFLCSKKNVVRVDTERVVAFVAVINRIAAMPGYYFFLVIVERPERYGGRHILSTVEPQNAIAISR
jgi:hypothetical protein